MALTGIDKVKLNKYLKEHANGDIYYLDMCDYLGKRGKIKDHEFLDHFTDCVIAEFSKEGKISLKHAAKMISIVGSFAEWMHEEKSEITEDIDAIKVETEVDNNGIMTITRTRNISISKLQIILENSEIVSIKEKDDGNIILEIIPDEYF